MEKTLFKPQAITFIILTNFFWLETWFQLNINLSHSFIKYIQHNIFNKFVLPLVDPIHDILRFCISAYISYLIHVSISVQHSCSHGIMESSSSSTMLIPDVSMILACARNGSQETSFVTKQSSNISFLHFSVLCFFPCQK